MLRRRRGRWWHAWRRARKKRSSFGISAWNQPSIRASPAAGRRMQRPSPPPPPPRSGATPQFIQERDWMRWRGSEVEHGKSPAFNRAPLARRPVCRGLAAAAVMRHIMAVNQVQSCPKPRKSPRPGQPPPPPKKGLSFKKKPKRLPRARRAGAVSARCRNGILPTLFRPRRSGDQARSRSRRCRVRRFRGGLQGQARRHGAAPRAVPHLPRRCGATKRSTI